MVFSNLLKFPYPVSPFFFLFHVTQSFQCSVMTWYVFACVLSHLSLVRLFATLQTVACQDSLTTGFSRQEYWSGLSFPSPQDLSNRGIEPASPATPALQVILYCWATKEACSMIYRSKPWGSKQPGWFVTGFLSLITTDILGWIILCWRWEGAVLYIIAGHLAVSLASIH